MRDLRSHEEMAKTKNTNKHRLSEDSEYKEKLGFGQDSAPNGFVSASNTYVSLCFISFIKA